MIRTLSDAPDPSAVASIDPNPDFIDHGFATFTEFLRELGCSRPTLDKLIREGLPHVNIGTSKKRYIRIPRAAAMAWLRARP